MAPPAIAAPSLPLGESLRRRDARFVSASLSGGLCAVEHRQTCLARAIDCEGKGLHSAQTIRMRIKPAPAHTGIVFQRTDSHIMDGLAAHHDYVCDTTLSSSIGNGTHEVKTIEHLMAALALAHIDNAIIEIDGGEVPILDGSSEPFMQRIAEAGTQVLTQPRNMLRITQEVRVDGNNGAYCVLSPQAHTSFEAEIDFSSQAIRRQSYALNLNDAVAVKEISRARTFCHEKEVASMRAQGLGQGGSLDNAIVVDDAQVLNEGGLRHPQEFAQHKVLDAIGDMYLLGMPFIGHYRGYKAGHTLHHALRQALLTTHAAFVIETATFPHNLVAAE